MNDNFNFPLTSSLGLHLIEGDRGTYVSADDLETKLEAGTKAYGCGNADVGSLTYGPTAKPDGFEIKARWS